MSIKGIIKGLGFSQVEWSSFSSQEKMEHLIGYIRDIKADNRKLKSEIDLMVRINKRVEVKHDRAISRLEKRNEMLKGYVGSYSKRKSKRGS